MGPDCFGRAAILKSFSRNVHTCAERICGSRIRGPSFANEPERKHFAEYLTGLIIANKKNVSAIGQEYAVTTDRSCFNRWVTEAEWDEEAFNNQRLDWLQRSPDNRLIVRFQATLG